MNSQINWNVRLLQIAKEHPDAPGKAGEILRATLARQATSQFTHDLQLSHACARETVVNGVRMALRCGVLLLKAKASLPAREFATLLRVVCIFPEAAESYMLLAQEHPELGQRCLRRRGRISEVEAHNALRGSHDTVANLQILLNDK